MVSTIKIPDKLKTQIQRLQVVRKALENPKVITVRTVPVSVKK